MFTNHYVVDIKTQDAQELRSPAIHDSERPAAADVDSTVVTVHIIITATTAARSVHHSYNKAVGSSVRSTRHQ